MEDRQLDLFWDLVETIRRVVENPDFVDTHMLTSYLDPTRSFEGELQRLKKDILSLDDMGECVQQASGTCMKGNLFNLRVVIFQLMEQTKKDPTLLDIKKPMMGGVNLPWIEVPTFDGIILNWWLFWQQFQATIHDKPCLGDVDKLICTCGMHSKGNLPCTYFKKWHKQQKVMERPTGVLRIVMITLELPTMSMSEASFKLPSLGQQWQRAAEAV